MGMTESHCFSLLYRLVDSDGNHSSRTGVSDITKFRHTCTCLYVLPELLGRSLKQRTKPMGTSSTAFSMPGKRFKTSLSKLNSFVPQSTHLVHI